MTIWQPNDAVEPQAGAEVAEFADAPPVRAEENEADDDETDDDDDDDTVDD